MKKKSVLVLTIVLLAIGYALVTTTLVISGTANIGISDEEFAQSVLFTNAYMSNGVDTYTTEGSATISADGKTIDFSTPDLMRIGDISELKYEVTNFSTLYDADITVNCAGDDGKSTFEYVTVTNTLADTIHASEAEDGVLKIKLTKSSDTDISTRITCTIDAVAVERDAKVTMLSAGVRPLVQAVTEATLKTTTAFESALRNSQATTGKVYVYNIGTDINVTTGDYNGYVVVNALDADNVEYSVFLYNNDLMILNYNVTRYGLPSSTSKSIKEYKSEDASAVAANATGACTSVISGTTCYTPSGAALN